MRKPGINSIVKVDLFAGTPFLVAVSSRLFWQYLILKSLKDLGTYLIDQKDEIKENITKYMIRPDLYPIFALIFCMDVLWTISRYTTVILYGFQSFIENYYHKIYLQST